VDRQHQNRPQTKLPNVPSQATQPFTVTDERVLDIVLQSRKNNSRFIRIVVSNILTQERRKDASAELLLDVGQTNPIKECIRSVANGKAEDRVEHLCGKAIECRDEVVRVFKVRLDQRSRKATLDTRHQKLPGERNRLENQTQNIHSLLTQK
jgi:hypothetical protein